MIINHNLNVINAHRHMSISTVLQGKSMEKLSSGLRIGRACDDAAGLAISEKMRLQIRGFNQASRNSQDGISMIQTAEGALSEVQSIGQRMREIAIQSANGIYVDEDRELMDQEFQQLKSEIDRISTDTEFNGNKILDGSLSGKKVISPTELKTLNGGTNELKFVIAATNLVDFYKIGEGDFEIQYTISDFQNSKNITLDLIDKSEFNGRKPYVLDSFVVKNTNFSNNKELIKLGGVDISLDLRNFTTRTNGTTGKVEFSNTVNEIGDGLLLQIGANKNQTLGITIENFRVRNLGLGGIKVSTVEDSQEAIERLSEAILKISSKRGDLGAVQNRLEHAISSTDNTAENLQASESRIRDVDLAREMMGLTKLNVMRQASQSMLAQANQAPQQVLSILK